MARPLLAFVVGSLAACATTPPPPIYPPPASSTPGYIQPTPTARPLFVGLPGSATGSRHYWGANGDYDQSAPLENFGINRPVPLAEVRILETPPPRFFRPLFTFYVDAPSPPAIEAALRERAGRWGADSLLRIAEVEHAPPWARAWRWSRAERVGSIGAWGATLREAEPGSEPYTGLTCSNYSPYGPHNASRLGTPVALPWIVSTDGPSQAAGMSGGALALSWRIRGPRGQSTIVHGNCNSLATAFEDSGPSAEATVTLLYPNAVPEDQDVTIPLTRLIGLELVADASGVVARTVRPGSAGAMGGVRSGDRLVAIDGQAVTDQRQVMALTAGGPEMQSLTVERGRAQLTLEVHTQGYLSGIAAVDVPEVGGLVIHVAEDSPAFRAGLAPGDLLLVPNWLPLVTGQGASLPPGDHVMLRVRRQGRTRELHFTTVPIPGDRYQRGG